MSDIKILIIDDEEGIRKTFSIILNKEGYSTYTAHNYPSALEKLNTEQFDLVFTDILLGTYSGINILKDIKSMNRSCPVIMITGEPNIDTASASVRLGAFDYVPKPIKRDTLLRITKHALRHKALQDEKQIIREDNDRYRCHLDAIFRSVEDAIVTIGKDQQVVQANMAIENICGLHPQNIMGKYTAGIKNDCSRMCWKAFNQAIKKHRHVHDYRIDCKKSGRPEQVVTMNVSPLHNWKGTQIGALMIIKDITRLSNLEKQLDQRHSFYNIISRNQEMLKIYELLKNLKDVETTVLITGNSGTGKELVARAIHLNSSRASHPFVAVNCSALTENLLESELFGHVKGAFTGAIKERIGRFGLANHGTILLDEIGDISPRIQLKLLRVLETKEFERVGDHKPVKIDVQIIAATNADLKKKIKKGDFREDLYYRLKVVEIKIPPLIQRRDDIPLLVNHYISVFNKRFNKNILGISSDVEKIFMKHPWPGNVRELIHTIEHAFVVCRKPTIDIEDLPPEMNQDQQVKRKPLPYERQDLITMLDKTAWSKAKAARMLGISRQTLYRKLQEYSIEIPDQET